MSPCNNEGLSSSEWVWKLTIERVGPGWETGAEEKHLMPGDKTQETTVTETQEELGQGVKDEKLGKEEVRPSCQDPSALKAKSRHPSPLGTQTWV